MLLKFVIGMDILCIFFGMEVKEIVLRVFKRI